MKFWSNLFKIIIELLPFFDILDIASAKTGNLCKLMKNDE